MKHLNNWRIPLLTGLAALIIGACFHGLRMHPENGPAYNLGVTMGIIMAIVSSLSFLIFIFVFARSRKKK